MEQTIYIVALVLTGLANLGMGAYLFSGSNAYRQQTVYYRSRMLTVLWQVVFGLGYFIQATFLWRYTWPTAASALLASFFHIGAICFNWGYIPLLNPKYLTKGIIVRDLIIYAIGLTAYWTVALSWQHAPMYVALAFLIFFAYSTYTVFIFYRTYNRVSLRIIHMGAGNMRDFIRWMQVCCDCIVLFGIGSVAITAIFPNDIIPFVLLLIGGVGMFAYMTYSIIKYGKIIS
jgi:hypothetical protein